MIRNLSNMDYSHKRERCGQYIEALEEERRKIHVFQRELPLCLNLVTQAIEACRKEIPEMTPENLNGQSECSEQTTGECGPVLEQFLTIKDSTLSNEEEEDHEEFDDEHGNHDPDKDSDDKNAKSDWLKSVQLWNQPETLLPKEECSQEEMMETVKRDESTRKDPMMNGCEGRKREAEKDGGGRKQRRCWSSQLHRRFLNALQHLGGPHVATPKQIREMMKVDGLTNDEVKSHLQKYRLHTRRPNQTAPNNGNSQTQHFVVVGNLWVPQADYSTGKITGGGTTSTTTTSTGIYGAMAAPPPRQWPSHSNFRPSSIIVEEGSASHSTEDVVVRCSSPAMSSSTRNHYVKKI